VVMESSRSATSDRPLETVIARDLSGQPVPPADPRR
jgi:hypothetical protein